MFSEWKYILDIQHVITKIIIKVIYKQTLYILKEPVNGFHLSLPHNIHTTYDAQIKSTIWLSADTLMVHTNNLQTSVWLPLSYVTRTEPTHAVNLNKICGRLLWLFVVAQGDIASPDHHLTPWVGFVFRCVATWWKTTTSCFVLPINVFLLIPVKTTNVWYCQK